MSISLRMPDHFEPACRAAVDELRAALIELYADVGADPVSPQDVARRFRVNKTLTWNVSRVITGGDSLATISGIPGSSALRGLLTAFEQSGARPQSLERVRVAAKRLDDTVAEHVGDRATLELVIDGIGPARADHLELSRKLTFRGNSGLWGVQAKTRLMTAFLAPNADDPGRLDMAIVRGYLGLRRLRSEVRWPIFQLTGWGDDEELKSTARWEPIEPSGSGSSALPLMRGFSNVTAEQVEEAKTADGWNYVLAPGPIGNAGSVDCFVGDCLKAAAPRYRAGNDTIGELGATISAPTERLIFDLLVHESLDFALTPRVQVYGGALAAWADHGARDEMLQIPVFNDVARLPGRPPVVATPYVPRYSEVVQSVCDRMQWTLDRFRGCRFELSYPPMGSTVFLQFPLPESPDPAHPVI
jgi:hypothetical protein